MNKYISLSFALFLVFSCNRDETLVDEFGEVCEFKTDIVSPIGYELNSIGKINFNGSVYSFQFVGNTIGYAMLGNNAGGYVEVFKTVDGGKTWKDLDIGIKQFPRGMVFKDENTGIITVHDVTGCPPPNCQNKCVILKTKDGGMTWREKEITNLKGILYHPKYDDEGNLYSLLTLKDSLALLKSTDDGETWSTFFTFPDLGFQLVTYSYEIFEDRLYISGKGGKILVVNSAGDLVKTMEVGSPTIWDVEILDENNLILVVSGKVIKTMDGGVNWTTIFNESARMVGFDSSDNGIMLLQKSFCPTDVYQVNDVIGVTIDGGLSWIESDETTTNLHANFQNSQKIATDSWHFMIGNELLEIKGK